MIEVLNKTSTALTAGQNIPLGGVSAKSNNNATLADNTIQINQVGYYNVIGQFVLTATAAGTITVQLYVNGNAVEGAYSSATVAEGDTVTLDLSKAIKVIPSTAYNRATVSYQTSTASTLVNSIVNVQHIL